MPYIKKYNILYVDDESSNLISFKLLYRRKFNIITAESGEEGLNILSKQPIHLIITDQRMPVMTGVEFLKKVKEKWPDPKCILLTGFTDNEAIKEAINEVGIYWYMNKPFDGDQMEQLIKKAIEAYLSEKEKKAVDEKLKKILASALDVIITIDEHQVITMVNPIVVKMFGYEINELIGQPIEILIPRKLNKQTQLDKDFKFSDISSLKLVDKTIFGRVKSGKYIPVEISLSDMELNGKKYYNAIIRDVSLRTEAYKLLGESEEKFRGVFNSMVDVFIRTDMNGTCKMVSPSVYDIFGFKPEEISEQSITRIFNDAKDGVKFSDAIWEKGYLRNFRIEGKKKDGGINILSLNSRIYKDENRHPIGIENLIRDITEQHESEMKIRLMNASLETEVMQRTSELEAARLEMQQQLDTLNETAIVTETDPDGNIIFVNDKLCEISGYSREELLGKNPRILKSGNQSQTIFLNLWKTITSGKVWKGEIMSKKKDDQGYYWVNTTIMPFKDNIGNIVKYVCIQFDITDQLAQKKELEKQAEILKASEEELQTINMELKASEEELREKAEELAITNKFKSEFLANMSHELRTPLNSILLLSKLMSENTDNNLTNEQIEFTDVIHNSGKGLLELINEILDLNKIESGNMELHLEKVKISSLLKTLDGLFGPLAEEKGIMYESEIDKIAVTHINTDKMRLEQVLINLLSNAIKFTSKGHVKIRVSIPDKINHIGNPELESGSFISFEVNDTGIGISKEKQKLVFEPFRQADGSTHRKFGGTGLGLSISREISGLLGGTLMLDSIEGKGSTFTLYLPIEFKASE